jgi:hypothetical protein
VADDNSVISEGEILHFDKGDDRLEAIGLSFNEAKAVLVGIQGSVVTAQAAGFLARHLNCDLCGSRLLSKGPGRTRFRTAFGTIALSSPRFHCCACRPGEARTFSPLNLLLTECVAPELLYLETRWASLMSYGMTADLLKDVLPIGSTADASTIRRHLHKVAARHDAMSSRVVLTRARTSRSRRKRSSSASTAATSETGTTNNTTSRSWSANPWLRAAMTAASALFGARMSSLDAASARFCYPRAYR